MDLFANNFHGLGFGSGSPFGLSNSFFNDAFFDFHPFSNSFKPERSFHHLHPRAHHRPSNRRRNRHFHRDPFFDEFSSPSLFESGSDYLERVYNSMNAARYNNYRRQLEQMYDGSYPHANHGFKKFSRSLSDSGAGTNTGAGTGVDQSCSNKAQVSNQAQPQVSNQAQAPPQAQTQTQAPTQPQQSQNRNKFLSDYFSSVFDDHFFFPSSSFFNDFFDFGHVPASYRQFLLDSASRSPLGKSQGLLNGATHNGISNELVDPNNPTNALASASDSTSALTSNDQYDYQLETLPEAYLNSWSDLPDNPRLSEQLASKYSDSSSGSYFQASFNNKDGWKYIKASWPHSGSSATASATPAGDAVPAPSATPASDAVPSPASDAPASLDTSLPTSNPTSSVPTVGSNGELRMPDPEDTTNEYIML